MRRDKCIRLLLVMVTILLFAASAIAASEATQYYPLGAKFVENMIPNGEYEIYVLTQDKWQQAGKITSDKFFRERELDLSSFLSNNREVRVKLIQKGGGAAHIDSVFLGGNPPVAVEGIQNGLKKLSKKDFDVADAFGKEILITFPGKSKDSTLTLTARIESIVISKTPFQFPTDNLYRKVDTNSQFYNYKIKAENTISPIFKEYSITGSGHPSGYTYGWVRNDDKNLYVKIDFTPDNTMDGDKDYAMVYVKTKAGLKEFKVSVPEIKWGNPDFTYTDKVSYQHKVYDFTIPIRELGINDLKEEKELLLAFAAYGTSAPPSADYSPDNNRYLVVYDKSGDIYGKFVSANGITYGAEFVICDDTNGQYSPSVAYDSVNQRYLVTWQDTRNSGTTGTDIYGQLVNANGTLGGSNFIISDASINQYSPSVAYDSVNLRYLVVWYDDRNSGTTGLDIYGQLVNANGTLYGTLSNDNFVISNATTGQFSPSVAYDSVNQKYLVVWTDDRNSGTTDRDIYGQFVNANGTLDGSNFIISNATSGQSTPSVAYDSVNQRYLVVWADDRNLGTTGWDIYGQLVTAAGSLYGTSSEVNFAISSASNNEGDASVAYDSAHQMYLVAWTDNRNYGTIAPDIYGQLVKADGSLYKGDFFVIAASGGQFGPVAAYNSICKNFLVACWSNWSGSYMIDQSIVGPCWAIDKSANQSEVTLSTGQQLSVNYSVKVDVPYHTGTFDQCIAVSDTYAGDPADLGSVCYLTDTLPYTFTYSRPIGPYEVCGNYTVENTASFVTDDTATIGSDKWTITVHVPCGGGCTLSQGYWKTHSKYGPAPYDDTWAKVGEDTAFYLSGQTWYAVLWTTPAGGNAYYILAHQYIAAKLNILNGAASTPQVDAAIAWATTFFNTYTPSSTLSKAIRKNAVSYASILDRYNNGYVGPGHCSE
jgi:hypothetical protein